MERVRRATTTPSDFPRATEHGWPSGAVTKYVASFDGERYSAVVSDQERYDRYLGCCDLLDDLLMYSVRKTAEFDDRALYQRIVDGLRRTETGLSQQENEWVLKELVALMRWELSRP